MITCPYCGESNGAGNIIDECHLQFKNMNKQGNTRYIYLCRECGEVFESRSVNRDIDVEVDVYIRRSCQYSTHNLKDGFKYMA
jgi:uncharacterized Zn finger protein